MGDKTRNKKFSEFIKRVYPQKVYHSICVVADGNAELSTLLVNAGYKVRMIEPNPRNLVSSVKREAIFFTRNTHVGESLIVAMHPDEATIEVVLAAKLQNKPFAIVPCCIKGDKKIIHNIGTRKQWISFLMEKANRACYKELLNISGPNTIIYCI